jgi:hypothetical protein
MMIHGTIWTIPLAIGPFCSLARISPPRTPSLEALVLSPLFPRLTWSHLDSTPFNSTLKGGDGEISCGFVFKVDEAVARVAARDWVNGDVNLAEDRKAAFGKKELNLIRAYVIENVAYGRTQSDTTHSRI